jgi:hypothetical protein
MKKIFAAALAVLMLLTLSTSVFAGFDQEADLGNVKYTFSAYADKPVIDGILDENGYAKLDIKASELSYAYNDTTTDALGIAKALSFDVYASYDADYVYFFVSADATNYFLDADVTSAMPWGQSILQLGLAKTGTTDSAESLEIGYGRNSENGAMTSEIWYKGTNATPDSFGKDSYVAGTDYQIILDGNRIIYEARVPATDFNGAKLTKGGQFLACIVVCMPDKELAVGGSSNGYIMTQVASGVSGGKVPANFAVITLGDAIVPVVEEVVEETSPATEAPAATVDPAVTAPTTGATTAPQTGDAGIIVLVVLMAGAVCAFVLLRKRTSVR